MINLKTAYGKKYRVEFDKERYSCDIQVIPPDERNSSTNKAWYYSIPCKYGEIEISDESDGLMFYCTSSSIAKRINEEMKDRLELFEPADGEAVIYFREKYLEEILKYARPRRRKQLSEEQKQKLTERLRVYREKSCIQEQFRAVETIQMTLAV